MMQKTAAFARQQLARPAVRWGLGLAALLCCGAGLVYYWRVFYYFDRLSPSLLTCLVCGLFAVLWLAMLGLRRLHSLDSRAAACILLCGALFCFANPPLQTPDELSHFLRSWSISEGHFDFDAARTYPEDVARLVDAFPGAWVSAHTSQTAGVDEDGNPTVYSSQGYGLKQRGDGPVESVADGFAAYFDKTRDVQPVGEPLFFMILPMLPQALAIFAARTLGGSALCCLYAARLANLAGYAFWCWLALKNCRRYKPVFLAMMLLPLSLFMAASCSYDAMLLGCYYLVASFYCKDEITDRDVGLFLLAFALVNVAKPYINLLWLALPLILPRSAWKTRWKKWQVALAGLALALAVTRFFEWYGVVFRYNYGDFGRVSQGADQLPQLLFVLKNPLRYLAVMMGTLYENNFFIGQLGVFGALDMPIPLLNLASPAVLVFAAALSAHERSSLRPVPAIGLGALSLVYMAGAMTALYITWTPVGMVRIIGLQARYFLPSFLMLFVLAAALLSHVVEPRLKGDEARPTRLALALCTAFAVVGAVLLAQHYFIGPVYQLPA